MRKFIISIIALVCSLVVLYMIIPLGGQETLKEFTKSYGGLTSGNIGSSKQKFRDYYMLYVEGTVAEDLAVSVNIGPNSSEVNEWISYINNINLNEIRKKIVLEALDCVSKGVVYHQLRSGLGTASRCMVDCDHEEIHTGGYNFATMAHYKIEDPLYLDCSYFVKHCYYTGGINIRSSTTRDMSGEFSIIAFSELIPGDTVLKSGHVRLFIGRTESGSYVFAEAQNHTSDIKISESTESQLVSAGYTARTAGTLGR